MLKTLRHSQFWLTTGLLIIDSLFFTLTNPSNVASVLLMVGFILLALTMFIGITKLLALSGLYGLPLGPHKYRLALFGTAVLGGLVALQSIGELTIRDLIVVLPLALILYVYLSYTHSRESALQS